MSGGNAESNMKTVIEKREIGKPFRPGQSGNPGGRPKSQFTSLIRASAKDGKELVDYMFEVFRDPKRSVEIRMEAAEWLANRGWGRPSQSLEVDITPGELQTIVNQIVFIINRYVPDQSAREMIAEEIESLRKGE